MFSYLISLVIAIVLLYLGEKLPNETKGEYIKAGYDWDKVILYSNVFAILAGLFSIFSITFVNLHNSLHPEFIPFATTITAYITTQSLMTDLRVLLINRKILRVAYLSMYILTMYNVFFIEEFKFNKIPVFLFTIALIALFIFNTIGASDIRALGVALPFAISIDGYLSMYFILVSLILTMVYMFFKRRVLILKEMKDYQKKYPERYEEWGKKDFNKTAKKTIKENIKRENKMNTPVGPIMILPFLIFLLMYPYLTLFVI